MKTPLAPAARYMIVDEIAAGGMGAVFLALQTDDRGRSKPVAIKKLHAHLAEDASTVDSFVDEARIAYRLRHPNVVRVHDVLPIEGQLVIVMDWVEGVALRTLGKSHGDRLPIPIIRRMLVDALEGLHAAHELTDDRDVPVDLVHRDISPQNLLVGTDGLTRVTDFGIALAKGRLAPTTMQGGVKGKIPYLSPEQVNRTPIDRRSDIFAAGVVAWELLTGKRLFSAASEGEIMAMILREPIQPPSALRMDVPLDLDELVLKALERRADRRFSTAQELAHAIAEGGPLAAHEEVGRLVASTAGTTLAARRQKLAHAAERGAPARSLEEEMTATFVAAPRVTAAVSEASVETLLTDDLVPIPPPPPRNSAPPLPPPPLPIVSGRSTTPVLLAVVLALGLAIVFVVKYTGPRTSTPSGSTKIEAAFVPPPPPAAPKVEPPAFTPVAPAVAATPAAPEPAGPAPMSRAPHRPISHGKRDSGAGRAGQPFMPDDL